MDQETLMAEQQEYQIKPSYAIYDGLVSDH